MPPVQVETDPETLLRGAVAGISVTAYSRGIAVTIHVDNRLPGRLAPKAAALGAFLRRGLLRTIAAGNTPKIALALWRDATEPDGRVRALLEVCRERDARNPAMAELADIWALPLGGGTARPAPARRDAAAESVLIPLDFDAAPGAALTAERWRAALRGRRLLHLRDPLFDDDRHVASMAAIGAAIEIVPSPDAALDRARAAAAEGRPIDVVVLDGHRLGRAAVDFARRARAEPALAHSRLVLASAPRDAPLAAADAALFDATPWPAAPWRRLLEVLAGLFRKGGEAAVGPAPVSCKDRSIPALTGRRILLAEDVATNQALLQAVMAPTGASLEVVPDGAAAVARHRAEPAELIIMDLQMPGMGGFAALRQIRALGGAAGAVPVVALTAYARATDRRKALAAGMDAYLAKPIVVAEFYELLGRLLPAGVAAG